MPFPAITLAGAYAAAKLAAVVAGTAATAKSLVDSERNNNAYRKALKKSQQSSGVKKILPAGQRPSNYGTQRNKQLSEKNGIRSTTDPRSGVGEHFLGKQEGISFIPKYGPEQEQGIQEILQNGLRDMRNTPLIDFSKIEDEARHNFKNKTIPDLLERYVGQGYNKLGGSSGFENTLASAGTDLDRQLAALRQGANVQNQQTIDSRLSRGLTPLYEPTYQPSTPGSLENISNMLLKAGIENAPEIISQLKNWMGSGAQGAQQGSPATNNPSSVPTPPAQSNPFSDITQFLLPQDSMDAFQKASEMNQQNSASSFQNNVVNPYAVNSSILNKYKGNINTTYGNFSNMS